MAKPLVIFHAGCADGFCSAWVARRGLNVEADYVPMNYGDPLPIEMAGRRLYVLDFSFKRPVMEDVIERCESLVLLDHHKTAVAELQPFLNQPHIKNIDIRFDMEKSGGRMAWEYFFPDQASPWLVNYTEDRDLWRWKLPNSRQISAALRSYPFDFSAWDDFDARGMIGNAPPESLIAEGAAILRFQAQLVDDAARFASEIDMDGHKVLSVNTTCLVSEVGERLAEGRPFSATFFVKPDGTKVWSLRSRGENGIDVSEVAKKRGGGGHKSAAGFTESVQC